CQHYYRTPLTF
nr:immunoglobulin light chain junction region [Macaca mulatta]MPN82887.1 immunoglobulin light chain junction region [Macaca mulatta]MPN83138.1 immunoglobulin light chain junction region [Macaca mulatta]